MDGWMKVINKKRGRLQEKINNKGRHLNMVSVLKTEVRVKKEASKL